MDKHLIELLKLPTEEIISVGSNAKIILKEWHKVTLLMPEFCDCKLKSYVEFLKIHYYDYLCEQPTDKQ